MLSRILDEIFRFKAEGYYFLSFLSLGDKLALLSASLMIFGVFLPWLSAEGYFTQTGLMAGGDIHLILALFTIYQVSRVIGCKIKAVQESNYLPLLPLSLRRVSFYYMLIGTLSTIFAIGILLYFGSQHKVINSIIDIRLGFYMTTFSGVVLFFLGLERFCR